MNHSTEGDITIPNHCYQLAQAKKDFERIFLYQELDKSLLREQALEPTTLSSRLIDALQKEINKLKIGMDEQELEILNKYTRKIYGGPGTAIYHALWD